MPRPLLALASAGLVLACLPRPSAALTRTVPDDVATIQLALEGGADTVFVRSGHYPEALRIEPERPLLMAGHPENATRPRLAAVTMVHRGPYTFRDLHFATRITLHTTGDSEAMAYERCQIDAGLIHYVGDISDLSRFAFVGCRISGEIAATPSGTVFHSDTLVAGTIRLDGEGALTVTNCRFTGPGATAIDIGLDPARVTIEGNEITGYEKGVRVVPHESTALVKHNVFKDITGAAVTVSGTASVEKNTILRSGAGVVAETYEGYILVSDNRIEDCGSGIALSGDFSLARILHNRVLRSLQHGITITPSHYQDPEIFVNGNVVAHSGRDGIRVVSLGERPVHITMNTVYLSIGSGIVFVGPPQTPTSVYLERNLGVGNGGFGASIEGATATSSCNDWYGNALGGISGGAGTADFDFDPLFCNLSMDDVRVAAHSPALTTSSCGTIGALGQGCVRPSPDVDVAERLVTPCESQGWTPLPGSESAVRISETYPRGGGSLELAVRRGAGVVGWRLPVGGQPLDALSALSVELLRSSATHARRDAAPAIRLLVQDRTGASSYLVWEARRNGFEHLTQDAWTRMDLVRGRFVRMPVDASDLDRGRLDERTLAEWIGGERLHDRRRGSSDPIGSDVVVLGVEIVALPFDGSELRAAADRLRIGFRDAHTLDDFEVRRETTVEIDVPPASSCGHLVVLAARALPGGLPGEIEFFDGERSLGVAPAPRFGWARLATSALAVGAHRLRAVFRGEPCVARSVSRVVSHEVQRSASTVRLGFSVLGQVAVGDTAILVATVEPAGATGEVTFYEEGRVLGRAPVRDGVARLERACDREGTFAIGAEYSGDDCRTPSVASGVSLVVLGPPRLRISDVSTPEGDTGERLARFTVDLSHPRMRPVAVDYATAHGTAGEADYRPARGTVTIPPGVFHAKIDVAVIGDPLVESDETFQVRLSSPIGATIADDVGIGRIENDDHASVVLANASILEGTGGRTVLQYPVRLRRASDGIITVAYRTLGEMANPPLDFASSSGTLVFSPGDTVSFIPITIMADSTEESDERFAIEVSWGSESLAATITIRNDDATPTVIIDPSTVTETDEGAQAVVVRARLSHPTERGALFVVCRSFDGTARERSDYLKVRGGTSFIANQMEAFFQVSIIGDDACEPEESFAIAFEVMRSVIQTVQTGVTTITIRDDDCDSSAAILAAEPVRGGGAPALALESATALRSGLDRIAPNPATAHARVEFTLARTAPVRVSVIDLQGREVVRLAEGTRDAGRHVEAWDGRHARGTAAPGLYFVRCEIDGKVWTRRLVVAR